MDVLILADDRTGAFETAGACAERSGSDVLVRVAGRSAIATGGDGHAVSVCDIGTRHLDAAAARVEVRRALEETPSSVRQAHKIDSTLRGNWAHELAERVASGQRILLVPALPSLGRVCVDGTVLVDGVPVAEHMAADARAPVRSSRPTDHLIAAGVTSGAVRSLRVDDVAPWLRATDTMVSVVDASTGDDLACIAAQWALGSGDVVLAGTSEALAAGVAAAHGGVTAARTSARLAVPLLRPLVVVCGSLHAGARRQLDALAQHGVTIATTDADDAMARLPAALAEHGVAAIASPIPRRTPVSDRDAENAATSLAATVSWLVSTSRLATVVIVGGDTAAAVLGSDDVLVGGLVAPGTPWLRGPDGTTFVTRAGGFGGDDALLRLL